MYCIQYDEICKKHNFELKHDALGERVTLEYPADSVPKDTIRLFQNHLPEGVSAMAEKYSSDRFAIFKYNAAAAAGNTIWCHPRNSCLLSLRGIVGADQIVQWDTRYGEMTGKDNAIGEE